MSADLADDFDRPAGDHGFGLAAPRGRATPVDLVAPERCTGAGHRDVAGRQATMAPAVTLLKEEVWSACDALVRGDEALSCVGLPAEAEALRSVAELLEDRLLVTQLAASSFS